VARAVRYLSGNPITSTERQADRITSGKARDIRPQYRFTVEAAMNSDKGTAIWSPVRTLARNLLVVAKEA
jgi:hypothetical protein